ncbi:oligosaccharide flippase family protein [Hyphococcus flavus]|uniref:Oligosaccharide flippase family protein n=1 Tax=Hyphococcus flavus TaxID=1866326 RepID=A0AAE9ZE10_9PROT|nr:oligosaccharide flippase family protein [Hyphococcus flavus]WDI33124.1 oligosaccharide flippase family protein [Hyphococcus flavus]
MNSLNSITAIIQRPLFQGPVARGAVSAFVLRIFNLVLGFLTIILLGRYLGADGYGVYALAVSTAALIAMVGSCGFDHFLVAALPRITQDKQFDVFKRMMRVAITATLLGCALTLCLGFGLRPFAGPVYTTILPFIVILTPIMALATLAQGALRGLMRAMTAYIPEFLIVQVVMLTGVIALIATDAISTTGVLVLVLFAWSAACATAWIWVQQASPKVLNTEKKTDSKKWLKSALWLNAAKLSMFSFGKVELLILAAMLDEVAVGLFAIAMRLGQLVLFPAFAVSAGLAPSIARRLQAEEEVHSLIRKSLMASSTLGFLFVPAVGAGAFVMFYFTGAEFTAAWPVVAILAVGFAGSTLMGRGYDLLLAAGKERLLAFASLTVFVVNIISCIAFTAAFGLVGTAVSSAAAFITQQALFAVIAWRTLHVRVDAMSLLASGKTNAPLNNPQDKTAG